MCASASSIIEISPTRNISSCCPAGRSTTSSISPHCTISCAPEPLLSLLTDPYSETWQSTDQSTLPIITARVCPLRRLPTRCRRLYRPPESTASSDNQTCRTEQAHPNRIDHSNSTGSPRRLRHPGTSRLLDTDMCSSGGTEAAQ